MMAKSTVWTGLFRGTATLGIGTILYLQQNYTPREKFEDYTNSHHIWSTQVLNTIDDKLARLERGQEAIQLELRTMNRKTREAAMAIPQK